MVCGGSATTTYAVTIYFSIVEVIPSGALSEATKKSKQSILRVLSMRYRLPMSQNETPAGHADRGDRLELSGNRASRVCALMTCSDMVPTGVKLLANPL